MPVSEAILISRVQTSLMDASGVRFGSDAIKAALSAEARALFASPSVPSDMLQSVCTNANKMKIAEDGKFSAPTDYLRICVGYVRGIRISDVIDSAGPGEPTNVMQIKTRSKPGIFIEAGNTYLLPPGAFTGDDIAILYIKQEFPLASIPPSFEDAIVYGAASRIAADNQEVKLAEILEKRAAVHLARVIGKPKEERVQ